MEDSCDSWLPDLQTRILFILNVSQYVTRESLRTLLGAENIARLELKGIRNNFVPKVVFKSIASAERALAICNCLVIPNSEPPEHLELSVNPTGIVDASTVAFPRWIKNLPISYAAGDLFNVFRPFGPIIYIAPHAQHGIYVQFRNEADARVAEQKNVMDGQVIEMQAYEPHRLFCANLPLDATDDDLGLLFSKHGKIQEATVIRDFSGVSRRFGFVSFKDEVDASLAVQLLRGTIFQCCIIHVEFATPRKNSKLPQMRPRKTPPSRADSSQSGPSSETEPKTCFECDSLKTTVAKLTLDLETAKSERDLEKLSSAEAAESFKTLVELNTQLRAKTDEVQRQLDIFQSRCKILELEVERLKSAAAHRRNNQTPTEEQKRQAEINESRRRMDELRAEDQRRKNEAMKAKQRKAQEEKLKKEEEERKTKAREDADRKKKEERKKEERRQFEEKRLWQQATDAEIKRCQTRDLQQWGNIYPWSSKGAFDRFKYLYDSFDDEKFSKSKPLTFLAIPWPFLMDPFIHDDPDDIDWDKVEKFFAYVKRHIGPNAEYKNLVQRAHRMFHPDRWRSRGLLETVFDPDLRMKLEKAGNMVAQALTPIWLEARKYD